MSDLNRRLMTRKTDFGETLLDSVVMTEPGRARWCWRWTGSP